MARPVSSLESHRQRQQIIDALVADTPYRQISAWTDPPVTIATLSRYKQHAVAVTREAVIAAKRAIANSDNGLDGVSTQAVTKAVMTVAADPFLSAVADLKADRARIKGKAEDAGDLRTWVAADRNDLTALELHARLANRLDTQAPATNIMIVCPAGAQTAPAVAIEPDDVVIDIGPKR